MPSFVAVTVAFSHYNRSLMSGRTKVLSATVVFDEATQKAPYSRSSSDEVDHLLVRYVKGESIAEANAAILCHASFAGIAQLQHSEAFSNMAIRIRDVYENCTVNDKFIES